MLWPHYSYNFDAPHRLFIITGVTASHAPVLWRQGEGVCLVLFRFNGNNGLYVYTLDDLRLGKTLNVSRYLFF